MKNLRVIIIFGLFIFCGVLWLAKENKVNKSKYVLISHTRLNDNSGIDSIVSKANLSKYSVKMLGGDMANLSSYNDSILNYLNVIFNISNKSTLWALGNHGYSNVDLVKKYTKRKTYYAYTHQSTLFVVLDTQIDSSNILGNQLVFFDSIINVSNSSQNIIILTHKLIWMRDNDILDAKINFVSNGHKGNCSYCVQKNNFYKDIYPKLINLKKQGKNVFCVAGDIGFNVKKIEHITKEGIVYLASGIKANQSDNYFLEFTQSEKQNKITYEFKQLKDL